MRVEKIYTKNFDILFDASSGLWCDDAKQNLSTLILINKVTNGLCWTRGYVYLYEVYRMLKYPTELIDYAKRTKIGWVRHYRRPNYINFDVFNPRHSDFISGNENCVWLHFNLDGALIGELC